MAIVSEELKDSIKSKISLKILGKNMMALPGIARDLNVARQNAQQLVKIMGGEAATGADAHMLKESERSKKFEVESEKEKETLKVQREESKKEEPKKPSFFEKMKQTKVGKKATDLKDKFSQNKFVKAFSKYFKIAAILGLVFLAFKDTLIEWAKGLYDTIKQKFDEFVGKLKEWFNEIIQPIIDKVKEFIMPIIDAISDFFKSIGDWFVDKFGFIGEWFTNAFSFVGKIVDSVKEKFEKFKEFLKPYIESALDTPIVKYLPPVLVLKALTGAKSPDEKEEEKKKEETQKRALSNVVDDSKESQKLQRQQTQAQEAEKERAEIPKRQEERQQRVAEKEKVAALEKEKQYTGTDEIVRARLGLPSVAASEMEVGPEVTEPKTPLAPTAVVAEAAPQKPPSPISAEPPTATAKQAEGPAGGGSLSSVASVQPGVDLSGINPEFEKRLVNMATAFKEQTGKKVLITSAYRSNEKQAELFNAKLAQVGGDRAAARRMVAEPMPPLGQGRGSFHLKGLAIDINSKGAGGINALAGSRDNPTGWLERFGLTRPVKNEDWHIQPSGTVPTADNPVSPGAPTLVAGKDGKPMNVTEGKKETMPQASAMQTVASGGEVSAASNQVSVSHREQIKPQTPVVVNAPVTNNNITQTNQTLTKSKPYSSSDALVNRVT
jgi:hypothetical protein